MDHVSANKTLTIQERENISGARVFNGEDQGKSSHSIKVNAFSELKKTLGI